MNNLTPYQQWQLDRHGSILPERVLMPDGSIQYIVAPGYEEDYEERECEYRERYEQQDITSQYLNDFYE
jgi:hypothetical protein